MAFLNFLNIAANGQDEIRREENEHNPDNLDEEVNGLRQLTLSCRVDSYSQKATEVAELFAEKGRTRLKLPGVRKALQDAGLAYINAGPVIGLPHRQDDIEYSRAAFDVTFGVVAVERAEPQDAQGTIGTVEMSSQLLLNADGSPTDPQVETIVTEP
jgi:hypothetical protein